ncbi:hypothetical protein D3C80_784410 [compost metagenome]
MSNFASVTSTIFDNNTQILCLVLTQINPLIKCAIVPNISCCDNSAILINNFNS